MIPESLDHFVKQIVDVLKKQKNWQQLQNIYELHTYNH